MVHIASLLSIAFIACTSGRVLPTGDAPRTAGPGYFTLPVEATPASPKSLLQKRKTPCAAPVTSQLNGYKYVVNLGIGNNYQPVVAQIDTGSSGLWVNPDCSTVSDRLETAMVDLGQGEIEQCKREPRYKPEKSASCKNTTEPFFFDNGDGNVSGWYFSDDVRFGEKVIKKQKLGVAKESKGFATSVLGLAPTDDENDHAGFMENLKAQGHINRTAFSLNFGSSETPGNIIFGGIDTKKYKGRLSKFPMNSQSSNYHLPLTAIGQTLPDLTSSTYWGFFNNISYVPASLDSSEPVTVLPAGTVLRIGKAYPDSIFDAEHFRFTVPCEAPLGTIDFTFGGSTGEGNVKTIHIPYSDFIVKVDNDNVEATCFLGMRASTGVEQTLVLGASFLRAAYVVFDAEGKDIWVGEKDDCGEHVVPMSKESGVPLVHGCGCEEGIPLSRCTKGKKGKGGA